MARNEITIRHNDHHHTKVAVEVVTYIYILKLQFITGKYVKIISKFEMCETKRETLPNLFNTNFRKLPY